jgi:mannose-1-phosphate guanylyltransferase
MGKGTVGEVFPVIMAGGSGTRFWPLSRKARPKQFLPLTGAKAMIVETFDRMQGLAPLSDSFVVCGALHAGPAAKLLKGLPKENVLVEPEARNTAPAIALACAHVAARNPQGVMVVMPSDQHVADPLAFRLALKSAIDVARSGQIVTLGIKPTRPETGYGYIQLGAPLQPPAARVHRFVEKPDLETAQRYLATGDYLWNAGIFVFRVDVMLAAFAELMPDLAKALDGLRPAIGKKKKYAAALEKYFPKMPATSIDYGVAEKASNIAVVRADCGWSDVGSFSALPELRPLDAHGNVVEGNAFVIDSMRSVVIAGKRPLAVVGMKDVVVIDAGDAMLVLPKDKAQDVRKVVEALKAAKLERFL